MPDLAEDPPLDTAWWKLDEPLRNTLKRSFVDRLTGQPHAADNLANAWYAGHPPGTMWEAMELIGLQGMSILTRLHERVKTIDPTGGTWKQIKYIRNLWWGGSAGFKVIYEDPEAMRGGLRSLFPRVAADLLIGSLEHQRDTSLRAFLRAIPDALTVRRAEPPDCDTFREVGRLGRESVHFCVARGEARPTPRDDIHIDWSSPVAGVDPRTRRCIYALAGGATHWIQAMTGRCKPVMPFDAIGAEVDRIGKRMAAGAKPANGSHEDWQRWVQHWDEVKWRLAARGRAGHDEALVWWREAKVQGHRLQPR